jgi:Na+/H+ antiporter NhaA
VHGWSLVRSLVHWINEGLMVFFFFVVGLEIKREIRVGELSAPRQATLPIIAAVGGMVFPALIYHMLNPSGECTRGWGVPMATDIAFYVGALVLLGLMLGKFIGITGASWLGLRLGIGPLPTGVTMRHIAGGGILGGIGFTMSIFIAELSFTNCPEAILMAKTGIILSSVLSGTLGYLWLRFSSGEPGMQTSSRSTPTG